MELNSVSLRKIIDSRTNPTVEAEINGSPGAAPSGASAGSHEASSEVPENLEKVEQEIKNKFEGQDLHQEEFDQKLREIDSTGKLEELGAAAIASSFSFKQASGFDHGKSFPLPLSNVVGGGEHGGNTSIQEFLVIPAEAESFPKALETNTKIYQELKTRYSRKIRGMNDEGALITSMDDEETLRAVKKVADKHGAVLGLDIAANELYDDGEYNLASMRKPLSSEEMLKFVQKLIDEFDLYYIEDPFHEDDFKKHAELTKKNPDRLICGDDLFTTNKERLQKGVEMNCCNSLIVKPNQIGTVTSTRHTVELAKDHSYTPVISHRSGETCDSTISDLALEWDIPIIKAGIADIRIAKLNQLSRLWDRMDEPRLSELP